MARWFGGRSRSRDVRLFLEWPSTEQDPALAAEAVEFLRRQVERYAVEMRDWYLRDKAQRRQVSKGLRGVAIIFAGAGSVIPLWATGENSAYLRLGYVLLGLAGIALAFDRFFGVSAAWMRDVIAAQRIDALILSLHISCAELDMELEGSAKASAMLHAVSEFAGSVAECVDSETRAWRDDFASGQEDLRKLRQSPSGDAALQ